MMNLKCFDGAHRRRILWIACFLVAGGLSLGPARAEDTSLDDSAKKAGNNFGKLLKGMGQELKKAGGSLSGSAKKNDQKETKAADKERDKDKEKSQ